MSIVEKIKIRLRGKDYVLETRKVLLILSKLTNEQISCTSEKELKAMLKEYKLYDEGFFENINNVVR